MFGLKNKNIPIVENAGLFKEIAERSWDMIFLTDALGTITYVSPASLRIMGYAPEEVMGTHFKRFLSFKDMPRAIKMFHQSVRNNVPVALSLQIKHKNGGVVLVELSSSPIMVQGKIVGTQGVIRDVTEKKQQLQALAQVENRWQQLYLSMREGVAIHELVVDKQGKPVNYRLIDINPAYEANTGLRQEQVVGKLATEAYGLPQAPFLEEYAGVVSSGEKLEFDSYFEPLKKHFAITALALGERVFATVFIDITVEREHQRRLRESEERYRLLFEHAGLGIGYYDMDNRVLSYNKVALAHMGMTTDEVVGKTQYDLFPRDSAERFVARLDKAKTNDVSAIYEDDVPLPNGEHKWFRSTFTRIKNFKEEVLGVQIISDEITESRNKERQISEAQGLLRDSEERLRVVFEHSPDGLYVRTLEGEIVEMNQASLDMLGYTREELLGKNLEMLQVESGADIQRVAEVLSHLKQHEVSAPIEVDLKKKDGSVVTVEARVSPMMVGGKKMLFGMLKNLTLGRRVEKDNKEHELFLEQVIDNIPAMIFVKDAADLKFIRFNQVGAKLIGVTWQEMIGKNDFDFFPKNEAEAFTRHDRQVLAEGKLLDIPEETIQTKYQGTRLLHTKKIPIMDTDGKPLYLLGISEDITDQKVTQQKIYQLSRAVDQSPASVVITDINGNIEYVNAKFTELTGYSFEEVKGKNPRILHYGDTPKEKYQQMWKAIGDGGEWMGELHNKKKSGEEYWENASVSAVKNKEGEIINYLAVNEDITQQKRHEIERQRSVERMKKQDETVIALAKLINQQEMELLQLIQHMLLTSAEILGVSRVSNWKITSEGRGLTLVDLYERATSTHRSGEVLDLTSMPEYTRALTSDRAIRVVDVSIDSQMVDLQVYLKENKIVSLLDVPIRVGGALTGVLCVESSERREWTDDEVRFVGEIADQLAQAVINHEKKEVILRFEQRSLELERINRVMVGRELRMVELKKEIERLKGGAR